MPEYFNPIPSGPGTAPGIEHDEIASLPSETGHVSISCMDYCSEQVLIQEINDLEEFLGKHRPAWARVRWINVDGLSDRHAIQVLATKYDLHPLAIEHMLRRTQRPKVETYGGEDSEFLARLFIVTHTLQIREEQLQHNQVSIFLGHNTVMTFQEHRSPAWTSGGI